MQPLHCVTAYRDSRRMTWQEAMNKPHARDGRPPAKTRRSAQCCRPARTGKLAGRGGSNRAWNRRSARLSALVPGRTHIMHESTSEATVSNAQITVRAWPEQTQAATRLPRSSTDIACRTSVELSPSVTKRSPWSASQVADGSVPAASALPSPTLSGAATTSSTTLPV